MALIRSAILACSAILGATLPAHATFQVIYDVLGVYDDGAGPGLGSATVMHCSNVGFNAVNVRVRAIRADGTQAGNVVTVSIPALNSVAFSTHRTNVFLDDDLTSPLATGALRPGRARIFTEVPASIICAAQWLDAQHNPPIFIAPLRMIRLPRGTSGGED